MTWTELEGALLAWVRTSTGLGQDAVYLAHQNGASRFPGPAAVVYVGDPVMQGSDDELRWDFDAGRPAGQEIHFNTSGWRTVLAQVSFFAPPTVGDTTARILAARAQDSLRLPSARSALNAVGIGVMDEGQIRWVPVLDGGQWQGSAVLELTLLLRNTASEATGYIASYEATITVNT